MNTREDFEIYEFLRNGEQWYGFKVDFFGRYSAPSKELILKKRQEIRRKVKAKLAWVEKENQKYYARLAAEERQRAFLLRQAKEEEKKIIEEESKQERKLRTQIVYDMMNKGMTNEQILLTTDIPSRVISRLRHEFENKKP